MREPPLAERKPVEATAKTSMVGKYQLVASLGQGGMANVYLALAAGPGGFNKLLVLKTMREDVVQNVDGGMQMFLAEARLTARLSHPNIVSTYDVGEHAGTYFLAMEYLEGQTYRAVCSRGRPDKLPLDDELRILSETARGLHHAHELTDYDGTPLHVVHRDVSPQNVVITYDGLVKLLDFGIAITAEGEHQTQIGVLKGKIDYIAPEQLLGDYTDRRADVFALGAMLWEAITGERFAGGPKVADVVKVEIRLAGGERRVRDVQPAVPEALAQIVDRAIAREPARRFESAAAFADALDGYMISSRLQPSAKSLARAVGPLFDGERQRMRKTIDEQLLRSQQRARPGHTGSLPAVRTSYTEGDSAVWGAHGGGENTDKRLQRSLAPLAPAGTGSLAASTPRHAPNKRSHRLATAVIMAATAAVIGGALGALTRQQVATSLSASALPSEATTPPARPPAHVPITSAIVTSPAPVVRLELTVSPPSARATLDGAPLAVPFSGEFRQDPSFHQLVVAADGYRPLAQLIAFDRNSFLRVTLERAAPAPRARLQVQPAQSATPAYAVTAAAAPEPARVSLAPRARGSVRPIDLEDPYANK